MPPFGWWQVSLDWATDLGKRLEQASWDGHEALLSILPAATIVRLLEAATGLLKQEPTVIDVRPCSTPSLMIVASSGHALEACVTTSLAQVDPAEPNAAVKIVGDTHGQLHDVLRM